MRYGGPRAQTQKNYTSRVVGLRPPPPPSPIAAVG